VTELSFKRTAERRRKIKPAGWIAIVLVGVILISAAAIALNAVAGRGKLEPLSEMRGSGKTSTSSPSESERAAVVWWRSRLRSAVDPVTGTAFWMAPDTVVGQIAEQHDGLIAGRPYEIKMFSEDGLRCMLGVLQEGEAILLYRLEYGGGDRQWTAIGSEIIPVATETETGTTGALTISNLSSTGGHAE